MNRKYLIGGGAAVVGVGGAWYLWRRSGLSDGAAVLPLGTELPRGVGNRQVELGPVVTFRRSAAEDKIGDLQNYGIVWASGTMPSPRNLAAKQVELKLVPMANGGAGKWVAAAAAAGWDVGIGPDTIVVQPHDDPGRMPGQWIGARQGDGSVKEVLLVHADPKAYTRALPALPSGVTPSYLWVVPGHTLARPPVFLRDYLESHGLGRGFAAINWEMLKDVKKLEVKWPKLTPELLQRWRTPLVWMQQIGWAPAVYNDEKFFDSRYTGKTAGPSWTIASVLKQDGPGDRMYLINTPKDGQSRYEAMKKKVDATAPSMGDDTWSLIQGLADAGARLDSDADGVLNKELQDMRKFYAGIVRDAGKAAGSPWSIATEVVAWLWENFLHGAGDAKAKTNTQDAIQTGARWYAMCLALGFPPNLAGMTYKWFEDLPTNYTAALNEIVRRAEILAGLQRRHLEQFMELPKAAREVIQLWWFLALEQIGKDSHAKSAFAALMQGPAGAIDMACDEQVYLVGYTMAKRYKIDPALFIPALWDMARGWSAWGGLSSTSVQGPIAPFGFRRLPNGNLEYAVHGPTEMAWLRANPDDVQLAEIDSYDPEWPDVNEPLPGQPGARYNKPGAVVVGFWAKADNSEYDTPPTPSAPKPIAVFRIVQNSTALNWFDLTLAAFTLAEKRKVDWRV